MFHIRYYMLHAHSMHACALHALMHTPCTLAHSMRSCTLHARVRTPCAHAHSMNVYALHALMHTPCTRAHSMHACALNVLMQTPCTHAHSTHARMAHITSMSGGEVHWAAVASVAHTPRASVLVRARAAAHMRAVHVRTCGCMEACAMAPARALARHLLRIVTITPPPAGSSVVVASTPQYHGRPGMAAMPRMLSTHARGRGGADNGGAADGSVPPGSMASFEAPTGPLLLLLLPAPAPPVRAHTMTPA
eukprot:364349-Chlamydomonas_euryale.AAC.12